MISVALLRRAETEAPFAWPTSTGCGSCRSYGKRPEGSRSIASSSRRFPQLLGRAAPAHRLHNLDNRSSLSRRK
jgi:hypothetical protein